MKICEKIKEKLGINIIKIPDDIEEDFIEWSDSYKLQESDFKGQIKNLKNTIEIATKKLIDANVKITSIKSKRIFYKIIKFKVTAIASRNRSWKNDDLIRRMNIEQLLHHEQKHFTVEEAFARKLRKKLKKEFEKEFSCDLIESEDPKITVQKEVEIILDKKRIECEAVTYEYQKKYDKYVHDERRKQIPEKQREYDEKITKLLQDS